MLEEAAILATALLACLAVLQLLLVAGLPLGRFVWGGQHDVLPTRLRIGSAVGIALYCFSGLLILSKARVVDVFAPAGWIDVALWAVTAFLLLSIPMNAISRSKAERMAMTPVVAALSLLFLYVTLRA